MFPSIVHSHKFKGPRQKTLLSARIYQDYAYFAGEFGNDIVVVAHPPSHAAFIEMAIFDNHGTNLIHFSSASCRHLMESTFNCGACRVVVCSEQAIMRCARAITSEKLKVLFVLFKLHRVGWFLKYSSIKVLFRKIFNKAKRNSFESLRFSEIIGCGQDGGFFFLSSESDPIVRGYKNGQFDNPSFVLYSQFDDKYSLPSFRPVNKHHEHHSQLGPDTFLLKTSQDTYNIVQVTGNNSDEKNKCRLNNVLIGDIDMNMYYFIDNHGEILAWPTKIIVGKKLFVLKYTI
jgi:hypothetical protein